MQVTCFKAGHILGASSILIEYKDRKILYTGDFTDYDLEAVKAQQLPKSLEVDILILRVLMVILKIKLTENLMN